MTEAAAQDRLAVGQVFRQRLALRLDRGIRTTSSYNTGVAL